MSEVDIHTACREGFMGRVKEMVAAGMIVNVKDNNGESPLYHAVEGNHINIVRFLLRKGASSNTENGENNSSPLIAASEHGYTHLAECLLEHKADVNQVDRDNCPPLYWAARKDKTETAELLLSRGAQINQADITGDTPLFIACMFGCYNTAALLLQNGADADICNDDGESPLHEAVYYGNKSIVQLLLQHGVRVVKNDSGETPLCMASSKMQKLNTKDTKNTGKIADYKAIISMLETYTAVQKSGDGSDTEGKLPNNTQESAAQCDKIIQESEDGSLTEGKVHKKPKGCDAQSDKIMYQGLAVETYQAEKEKGDSCIIDPEIVENVLANVRMKEQEKEVKRLFEGTEADNYLKDMYKQITNIGKEMKEPETTDDVLCDKQLFKMANKMEGIWKMVGGFLGVKLSEIKQLEVEYKTEPKYAAWNMLVGWRDSTEGSVQDKIQALKEALVDVERDDIADML